MALSFVLKCTRAYCYFKVECNKFKYIIIIIAVFINIVVVSIVPFTMIPVVFSKWNHHERYINSEIIYIDEITNLRALGVVKGDSELFPLLTFVVIVNYKCYACESAEM